ncbi:glycosyltransferase family 2 protein [Flavobacterium yafengii]|uniref:Glycosyltransferase family A protein n=1 Tax=Flavobacterium yafengii TaxID=3041253 RepID=A0AAW6TM69_9FLAO|nr:glycosyltransferase family A protein [Flavobacterium yafengii]MDI5950696.1 glycosyltransferase family A protein [Flavobacterium yafengii]
MNNPLVSIIVPCYNQAQYLGEALQSVLDQTYTNWECIVVNDGSPDETEIIAKQWAEKDFRFKYVFKENGGLSSARNAGIAIAKGEFILPLDADDKIGNVYTSLAMKAFQEDPNLQLVYCKAEKFGREIGSWILPDFSLYELARQNMIFCSTFFRKHEWERVGGYDINMIYGWEDWEFWISMLKNRGLVKCLDEVGFYYRVKKVSMIKMIEEKNQQKILEYVGIKHADFFIKQFGSFWFMDDQLNMLKRENEANLKSEKFVIDLFCETFFSFSFFGIYKKK